MARAPQQRLGGSLLNPALEKHRLLSARREYDIEIFTRSALNDIPAIAGAFGFVDDDGADRAPPCRFLELVGPAAIIGHRLAAELARDRLSRFGFEIGIVNQEQRDLAPQVDALEIVPAAFRRVDSEADEDDRCVGDPRPVRVSHGAEVDVLGKAERGGRRSLAHRHLRGLKPGPDERDGLGPAAILASRLEAGGSELLGEISDGPFLADRAHRAPLKLVGRQDSSDFGHALEADGRRSLRGCRDRYTFPWKRRRYCRLVGRLTGGEEPQGHHCANA
jgi:hypothetical protein